jgi:hypothetical protein
MRRYFLGMSSHFIFKKLVFGWLKSLFFQLTQGICYSFFRNEMITTALPALPSRN